MRKFITFVVVFFNITCSKLITYLIFFCLDFFCYLCSVIFKVCYAARGWAPFRAFVSGSAGLTPAICPPLQPSTAPCALRTAGRLSPARNTMINTCVSGWHRRQQKVTMVNSCASGWRYSRDKVIPRRGTGARQGERGGVVCCLTLRCACAFGTEKSPSGGVSP